MIPVQPRIFWLTLAVIVMAVIVSKFTPQDVEEIPGGFESVVLGLELARSPQDAATIADGEARRTVLNKNTYLDLGLIIGYTILWFSIGKRLNKTVAVAVLVAGSADLIEDLGMLMTLGSAMPSEAVVRTTYSASFTKWMLLGVVFVALACYFRPRSGLQNGWDVARGFTALAYAYSGILCLVGIFFSHRVIERAWLPLSVALILQWVLSLLTEPES
jgi:hypothetical protein